MLDALRASTQTWIGRSIMTVVMGLLIIAFGFWGIGDIFRGFRANELARVGSVQITTQAYQDAYQNQLMQLQQRQRRPISSEEARQMGLDREVLGRLVDNAVLDQEGHRLGLAMSNQALAERIMADDAFKGPAGTFDRQVFESRLLDAGISEQAFESGQRTDYLRQELLSAVNDGLTAPKAMLNVINDYYNEVRSVDYTVLPKTLAGDIPAPTEAQLKAYFDVHRDAYRTPEFRKVSILVMTPVTLADELIAKQPISDAEIEKRYQAVKAKNYTEPEHRHVEQIVFPDKATADAASAKLTGGESFNALVAERKLTPKDVDLGTVTKAALFDPAVANAAFALPQGGVSKPVKTRFGWAILYAQEVIPSIVTPLIAVKGTIEHDLALDRARQEINTIHDKIEDARDAGKTVAQAAKSVGLDARTIDAIDVHGRDKAGQAVPGLDDPEAVVKAVFASDIGVDNESIPTRDGGSIWFDVLGIQPARSQTFDEVKDKVKQAWIADEISKRLTAKAIDLTKKLDGGETLNAVATAQGNLVVKHIAGIKRSESQGLSDELLSEVFNRGVGNAGSAPGKNEGRVLFKVTGSKVPPVDLKRPDFQNIVDQMKNALHEDMLSQYVAQIEGRIGATINERAWQSVASTAPDTQ